MAAQHTTRGVVTPTLAVLGGWLTIMTPAVLTGALRMRDFDPSGLPRTYSIMLAIGWTVMIVALVVLGQVGDRLVRDGRSRLVLIRIAFPLLVVTGIGLALAPSPLLLVLAWVAAQLPAAAVITAALAMGGESVALHRRGLLSGLVGAASIVALLVGSQIVRLLEGQVQLAMLVTALVGALLVAPLSLSRAGSAVSPPPGSATATSPSARRRRVSGWAVFAAASFLLSWSTSTTNGFVVLFVDRVTDVASEAVASTTTQAVGAATLLAIGTSVLAGWLTRGRRSAALLWCAAAIAVAVALIGLLLVPTAQGVLIGAMAFGAGFGFANGCELTLLLALRHEPGRLGRDLGTFTAVTSAPYVLVPAVATVLLAGDAASGLREMFAMAAVLAVLGSVITGTLAVRRQTA